MINSFLIYRTPLYFKFNFLLFFEENIIFLFIK